MEFSEMWASFSKGAKEVAGTAVKKTTELTDIAKLKVSKKSVEAKIEDNFVDAGMLYYDSVKNNNDHTDEIAEIFAECDRLGAEIDNIKAKIAVLTGKKYCVKCGTELTDSYDFCPYCGSSLNEDKTEE